MSVTDSVSNKTLNQVLANSAQAKATDTSLAAAPRRLQAMIKPWARMRSCNCWSPS